MFNLFKSKKRDSDVEKSITAGSLLNLVNQSKEVRGIYTVPIEDIFAVIRGRIDNRKDKSHYPLDKIKEDYAIIDGKVFLNRYKRIGGANMTWPAFRALCEKWQEEYIGLDCTEIKDIFTDIKVLQYIKNDIYIKIAVSFYVNMALPMNVRIEMWSDDTDQLRQEYLKMIEMIDRAKYGE
nr:MAG TPA: hypothetical protein [Caudoviricetes sp.]